jgi:hypothetical protein
VVVLAGAKSTFLPVLGAGLGLAFAVQLLRRRVDRVLLAAGVLVVVTFGAAVVVLFGGQSQGLEFDPLTTVLRTPLVKQLMGPDRQPSAALLAVLTVFALLSWCAHLAGAAVVLRRHRYDPLVAVLVGCLLAGLAGVLLFSHIGSSQYYFLRAAMPLGGILTAWGVALALDRVGATPRRTAVLAVCAAAVGVGGAAAVATLTPAGRAFPAHLHGRAQAVQVLLPIALALLVCLGAALLGLFPGVRPRRHAALAAVLVALAAVGLLRLGTDGVAGARFAARYGTATGTQGELIGYPVTPANLAAARWLRDHSSPEDVVATNLHCRVMVNTYCDNRHFWLAAFTERRILVEGWGYTSRSNAEFVARPTIKVYFGPYWDPARLRANDEAFTHPTPQNLALLRDRWGVRWLFVHTRAGVRPDPALDRYAELRYQTRDAKVYALR